MKTLQCSVCFELFAVNVTQVKAGKGSKLQRKLKASVLTLKELRPLFPVECVVSAATKGGGERKREKRA